MEDGPSRDGTEQIFKKFFPGRDTVTGQAGRGKFRDGTAGRDASDYFPGQITDRDSIGKTRDTGLDVSTGLHP